MKKSSLHTAVTSALGITAVTSLTAISALLSTTSLEAAVLNFDDGITICNANIGTPPNNCTYGTNVTTGSYFSIDTNGNGTVQNGEKVPISQYNGIIIDGATTQAASGSHSGSPDGSESPDIDSPWKFFGNTGMHQTTSPISVLSNDGAGNVTLDFSGWDITWNGIASTPMGGDPANFGTAVAPNGATTNSGIANLTCGNACESGDTYVLNYAAQIPKDDPSNFGGCLYILKLVGTIDGALAAPAVPIPGAVWLFGSGLLSLAGLARRRKYNSQEE